MRSGLRDGLNEPGRGARMDIVAPLLLSSTPPVLPGLLCDAPIIVLCLS